LLLTTPCAVSAQDAENPGFAREDADALQDELAEKGGEFVENLAKPFEQVIRHEDSIAQKPPTPIPSTPTGQSGPPPLDDSDASIMADIDQLEGTPGVGTQD